VVIRARRSACSGRSRSIETASLTGWRGGTGVRRSEDRLRVTMLYVIAGPNRDERHRANEREPLTHRSQRFRMLLRSHGRLG
jgi:hypothetical protein